MSTPTVVTDVDGEVLVVTIDRPAVRNAIDGPTAEQLVEAFRRFDGDNALSVAVLTGAGGCFCSGADLTTIQPDHERRLRVDVDGDAPLGVSRMLLGKPVIAAVEGYAVAGGLELALWCDLRVAAEDAVFGVFCRRFGVPLMDGGTIRLARIVGQGRALDMILSGRGVPANEALRMGLADRVVPTGAALDAASTLAHEIARHPQTCMRSDRMSLYEQWSLPTDDALRNESKRGLQVISSGETLAGAERFRGGHGRHGEFGERELGV
jgi:enoyl-CoA hydratase